MHSIQFCAPLWNLTDDKPLTWKSELRGLYLEQPVFLSPVLKSAKVSYKIWDARRTIPQDYPPSLWSPFTHLRPRRLSSSCWAGRLVPRHFQERHRLPGSADQLDTSLSYHVYIVIFHYSSKHECILAHTCIPMYPLMMQDARIYHFSMLLLYEPHPSYLINIWTPFAICPLPFAPVLPIGGRTLCSGDGGRARARVHIRGPVAFVGVAPGVIEVVPVVTTVVTAWSGGSSWITWKPTIMIISQQFEMHPGSSSIINYMIYVFLSSTTLIWYTGNTLKDTGCHLTAFSSLAA